eukprot:1520366-Pyramimonas_sp.AAC.1
MDRMESQHAKVYKACLGLPLSNNGDDKFRDDHVLHLAQRSPLSRVLSIARLRYLVRLLRHVPPMLRVMLDMIQGGPNQ